MATNRHYYPMASVLKYCSPCSDLYLAIDLGSVAVLYGKVDPQSQDSVPASRTQSHKRLHQIARQTGFLKYCSPDSDLYLAI
ncbi:MAG: hypothetical protein VYA36_00625, partial [Pseudomonadota bacterium]|nr:hypothetical protein [Pseudomonadota bacterium]